MPHPTLGYGVPVFLLAARQRQLAGETPSVITHGRQINASNTGLNYHGIPESSLVSTPGFQNYSTPGQVVQGKLFNNRVDISGDNILVKDCKLTNGGVDTFGFNITGANVTLEGCLIVANPGTSITEPFFITNNIAGATIRRCDISLGCQAGSYYGTGGLLEENYFHDTSVASDPTQHPDVLEVYGGSGLIIRRCRLMEGAILADAVVNIAPWQASNPSVDGTQILDNYMQGGQEIILLDEQSTGDITNTVVMRNDMDQHTNPDTGSSFGVNRALTDYEGRPIYQTASQQAANPSSILWPSTTGNADVSRWVNPDGIIPDWTGLIVLPPQSNNGP